MCAISCAHYARTKSRALSSELVYACVYARHAVLDDQFKMNEEDQPARIGVCTCTMLSRTHIKCYRACRSLCAKARRTKLKATLGTPFKVGGREHQSGTFGRKIAGRRVWWILLENLEIGDWMTFSSVVTIDRNTRKVSSVVLIQEKCTKPELRMHESWKWLINWWKQEIVDISLLLYENPREWFMKLINFEPKHETKLKMVYIEQENDSWILMKSCTKHECTKLLKATNARKGWIDHEIGL